MRLIKSLRIRLGRRSTASVPFGDTGTAGLDAFAQEAQPGPTGVEPSSSPPRDVNARRLGVLLGALVLAEAVPAGLWIHQTVVSRAAAVSPMAVQPAPVAPAFLPSPPCETPPAVATAGSTPLPGAETAARSAGSASPRPADSPRSEAPQGLIAGLLSVAAPVPMHVFSGKRLIGTTEAESIMLPAGKHDLEFVSEAAGYRAKRTVTVQAGRTSKLVLDAPSGIVHVNATPWAAVTVDNRPVGETPIGNLKLPIGTREFVFRHPELGERRTTALVTLKDTARVSIDMRKK